MEFGKALPGLGLVVAGAAIAAVVGTVVPAVGGPIVAIALGAAAGAVLRRSGRGPAVFDAGLAFAGQRLLGPAIVLMGLGLPFGAVLSVGRQTAVVLVGTFSIGIVCAVVVGRLLALHRDSAVLVAVGTTICGASAIAAATAVLRPSRERVAYALGTIFVFNVLAVLIYPTLGRLLGMSQQAFGLWAGTAINDTSSVLAASVTFGAVAAHFAVIVKLVRSLLIVPMCVGLHIGLRRNGVRGGSLAGAFPLFVVLFAVASVVAGTGVVPHAMAAPLAHLSGWLIAMVLAAIGASLTWQQVRTAGARPLVYGGILSVCLAGSGLALQALTGWW